MVTRRACDIYAFATRAQTLLEAQLEQDPVRRLPAIWNVLLTRPTCTAIPDRCAVAEIVRRIATAFHVVPGAVTVSDLRHRTNRTDAGDVHVARALQYLCRGFATERATLEATAQECRISAPHLSFMVSRKTGISFTLHRRGLRFIYAAHLLAATALSPQELAGASGFRDTSALDHEFRLWLGMTPGEFRRLATD